LDTKIEMWRLLHWLLRERTMGWHVWRVLIFLDDFGALLAWGYEARRQDNTGQAFFVCFLFWVKVGLIQHGK
jgi:uncharacterized membrane protein